MRENISIALLVLISTAVICFIIIEAYDITRPYSDKEEQSMVSANGSTAPVLVAEKQGGGEMPTPSQIPEEPEDKADPARPTPAAATPTPVPGAEEDTEGSEPTKAAHPTPTEGVTPTPLAMILDMDYNSDVDDVAALRVATQLCRHGRIELRAVMASTAGDKVCKAMHAHLNYDGFGDVPVGMAKGNVVAGSPYWKDMTDQHFAMHNYRVYDSVVLYKTILREYAAREKERQEKLKQEEKERQRQAEENLLPEIEGEGNTSGNDRRTQEENERRKKAEAEAQVTKVRIVTTGFLVNIAALLSDPEGYVLVRDYVDSIWITGGVYLQGSDYNFCYTKECGEAANYVSVRCPVPLVYSSSLSVENEKGMISCGSSIMKTAVNRLDPVVLAFTCYGKANNVSLTGGRIAWDPFCVWAASLPPEETHTHLEPIHMALDTSGWNVFSRNLPANCQFIVRDNDGMGWYAGQLDMWIDAGLAR
ncbi:MAG: hypothetical protein IKO11_07690 [Lachnospiraceae bacterium]|nr:hypothetical protein [Lachnospiraceae bacterium]